jgi:hypothetical protein
VNSGYLDVAQVWGCDLDAVPRLRAEAVSQGRILNSAPEATYAILNSSYVSYDRLDSFPDNTSSFLSTIGSIFYISQKWTWTESAVTRLTKGQIGCSVFIPKFSNCMCITSYWINLNHPKQNSLRAKEGICRVFKGCRYSEGFIIPSVGTVDIKTWGILIRFIWFIATLFTKTEGPQLTKACPPSSSATSNQLISKAACMRPPFWHRLYAIHSSIARLH